MRLRQIKISELNDYINKTIKNDFLLQNVLVEGELSSLNIHHSRTIYFTIKDELGKLQCIFFRVEKDKHIDQIKDIKIGDLVLCQGNVNFHTSTGNINLIISKITKKDISDERIKFNLLKEKLEKKGYFDPSTKKELEKNPKKIGVVTSPTGAVIHDIYNVINRRYPIVDLILYPASVQGDEAEQSIINGIKALDEMDVDTIILARGGGSSEDMSVFNLESVVEAIFSCKTPIISAIGHETDFTLADFVSDVRASTPSVAGELSVPDIRNIIRDIQMAKIHMDNLIDMKFANYEQFLMSRLDYLKSRNFAKEIDNQIESLKRNEKLLFFAIEKVFEYKSSKLNMFKEMLYALNPEKTFEKGWSIAKKDKVINSVKNISKDDELNVYFKDGYVKTKVVEVNKYEI